MRTQYYGLMLFGYVKNHNMTKHRSSWIIWYVPNNMCGPSWGELKIMLFYDSILG
ncbi:hypothetical protein HanIR_Chr10g0481591 [Helianthus annuus]|nr:hypothetical protein HanIR_Chr10g0481591 [Helianthus annuus]